MTSKKRARQKSLPKSAQPSRKQDSPPPKPLWRRSWIGVSTSIIAPTIVIVLGAALLRGFGLDATTSSAHGDTSAPPVKIDEISFPPQDGLDSVTAGAVPQAETTSLLQRLNGASGPTSLRNAGEIDARSTMVEIHVEGNRPNPVRIVNIGVIKQCSQPLTGTLFFNPNAGDEATVKIGFNLDLPEPFAQEPGPLKGGEQFLGGSYFLDHEYDLSLREPATFVLTALTSKYYCSFHYVLDLLVNGNPTTEPIYNNGKPFQVSAEVGYFESETRDWHINFSAYRTIFLSPIVPPYGTKPGWHLGDSRNPPPQA